MVEDGTYTAVLDRFEGDLAVLVVEVGGEAVDDVVLPTADLPEEGRQQDAVFEIDIVDGDVLAATFDSEPTEQRAERAQDRFDRLARRPSDSGNEETDPDTQ